ncbi:MAG: glycosyltransferase family 39 protein [Chloroflexi bacterium]|uniref:Glycosyltransferase family 39 protein n=1 Tax=Candidatus Chlorohelix allophototropha TaxID=3003348 RepID=A0A8T7LQI7_9CHLR|nr:glycosyltransferase family 39 protein [Chloroflexota bacterium]WJW66164.1 glycosyltransferase family 39 protein [Chloroflexota bacterium L227-S17]
MSTMLEPISEIKSKIIQKPLGKIRWSWQSLPLGAILLLSSFLGIWNLSINGYSNNYYAAAVKSMIQSWSNFFFVSFDPGGFVTVDKPPVAFWVQAIFAKVLGFSGFSILLPEALAGVGSVFLLYIMVKRSFGTATGLVSALMLAITPIFVVMSRHNNPDSILVFTLMLAAWAMFRAADKGSFRCLLLAGALVGVAFNVKMLEAYVVLPAFYAMYFLLARTTWLKRIIHLAIVSVVIAVISLSWAVAVDLTPTNQRPYVDSSSVNSEIDLILNYNGLGRISGNEMGGSNSINPVNNNADGQAQGAPTFDSITLPPLPAGVDITPPTGFSPNGQAGGAPGGAGFGGQAGATRLITPQNGAEFNWFFPLAMLGIAYGGIYSFFGMGKGEERSRRLRSILLWGGWLLTFGVVFSFSKGVFHNYYLNIMAPAEAALAGIATVMLWKQYRKGGWMAYLLPLGIGATAFYQAYLLTDYTDWNWWLSPALVAVGVISLLGLVLGKVMKSERFGNIFQLIVMWVSMACLIVTPAVLSIRAVFTSITGSLPSATPSGVQVLPGLSTSSSSGAIPQAWLTFVGKNLSGQLILLAIVVGALLVVFGLRNLLRQQRWFNRPVISGVLLVMLLLGSTGWWINAAQAQTTTNTSAFSGQGMPFGGGAPGQGQANSVLVQYLVANQGDYKYLVAVADSNSASSYIIETGKPVMSLGGFSGSDNIVTSATQLEQMIANHTVRYFLLGGNGGRGGNTQVTQYVQQKCTVVSSSQYSGSGSNTSQSSGGGISFDGIKIMGGSEQLYVCGS